MATPRDVEDIDEKEERIMHAEAQGVEKTLAGEMVDAERDQAKAVERETKPDPKTEQK
jgi:LETM1 and EF-hand domain-containing protein 1